VHWRVTAPAPPPDIAGIIVSTVFIAVGLPIADPIIGLLISALIFHTTWESWVTIRRG
jgi:Co/Zn/Cd efflux system component